VAFSGWESFMVQHNRMGFKDAIMTKNLGQTAGRGVVVLGISQAVQVACTMLSTIIVARILSPSDYGVIAMTSPIAGFVMIFQNLGLNQAVIQSKTITEEQTNALFWYNMAASAAIAVLFVALSPAVSWFYGDSRPGEVMAAYAVSVLVSGLMLQHTALMNRNMRYGALSAVSIANAVFSLLFTILFAVLWRSYWALFVGNVSGTAVACLLTWYLEKWRPTLTFSARGTKSLLTFGANVSLFNLFNYISRNVDNVLIAKFWGAQQLGLYDRSYKLMMFPLQNINAPLSRVMLPTLSRVADDPTRYRKVFLAAIRALSLFSIPGVVVGAICSREVVMILLGSRWIGAEQIFFWLSLTAVSQPIGNATGWLFMSSGRAGAMMKWGLVSMPITLAGFAAGLPWGASGVAAAYFFSQMIRLPILFAWCTHTTPVRALDLYLSLLPGVLGGGLAYVVAQYLRGNVGDLALIAITAVCCYSFSLTVQAVLPGGRREIGDLFRLVRSTLTRRAKKSAAAVD
jgi:PST family polysaccharide transporter